MEWTAQPRAPLTAHPTDRQKNDQKNQYRGPRNADCAKEHHKDNIHRHHRFNGKLSKNGSCKQHRTRKLYERRVHNGNAENFLSKRLSVFENKDSVEITYCNVCNKVLVDGLAVGETSHPTANH